VKKKRRRLWCSSSLELETVPPSSNLGGNTADADLEDVVESCGGTKASRYVMEEEEEDDDEEEVLPLVHRDRHSKAGNDIPDLTPSGLVSL
jgi:hypothetical protein